MRAAAGSFYSNLEVFNFTMRHGWIKIDGALPECGSIYIKLVMFPRKTNGSGVPLL